MDISKLGSTCYRQFSCARIMKALSNAGISDLLRPSVLTSEQVRVATKRGLTRLDRYYSHITALISGISRAKDTAALNKLDYLKTRDSSLLKLIYKRLGSETNEEGEPGMALFLKTSGVSGRSFALLPEMENGDSPSSDRLVYMSSRWNRLSLEVSRKKGIDRAFRSGILRSNRLWQRERWSVLPVARDTVEPNESNETAYFTDISLHQRPVDGWVDAFWGVQSGIRIPIPIPNSHDSTLELLLTTFVPDAFRLWDQGQTGYTKIVPQPVATALQSALSDELSKELAGLSFSMSLLQDVCGTEASLLASAMRMIAHFLTSNEPSRLDWEKDVGALIAKLRQFAPEQVESAEGLLRLREYAFETLRSIGTSLPDDGYGKSWKLAVEESSVVREEPELELLRERAPKVQDLLATLQALQRNKNCTLKHSLAPDDLQIPIPKETIHPFLLVALLDNLVYRHKAHILVRVENHGHQAVLLLTAFYPEWTLRSDDEPDFLLKPLAAVGGRTRRAYGFYLTAQILWRCKGTIEYYRLGDGTEEHNCQAVIHLTIPLGENNA